MLIVANQVVRGSDFTEVILLTVPLHAWGERRYSSYSFSTSALDWGERSASRPGRTLAPGNGLPVPTVQEAIFWSGHRGQRKNPFDATREGQ
jgi:hypothetical protein